MSITRRLVIPAAVTAALLFLGGGRLMPNQDDSRCARAEKSVPRTSTASAFCPVRAPGELCPHRASALLNLKGERQARWNAALQSYNQTVESAQRQLLEEGKKLLAPEQVEQVKTWFAAKILPPVQ